jgi:hypothetical protein
LYSERWGIALRIYKFLIVIFGETVRSSISDRFFHLGPFFAIDCIGLKHNPAKKTRSGPDT